MKQIHYLNVLIENRRYIFVAIDTERNFCLKWKLSSSSSGEIFHSHITHLLNIHKILAHHRKFKNEMSETH